METADFRSRQYEVEASFAWQIKAAPKGSPERAALYSEAYRRVKEIEDSYAPGLSETGDTRMLVHMVRRFAAQGESVLDVGCAGGSLVEALLKDGYVAFGIDVSGGYIKRAKERLRDLPCGDSLRINCEATVQVADVIDYDSRRVFSCIVMDNVIEHLVSDTVHDVLRKCHSMLSDGGSLIVLTPHRFSGPHDISCHFLPLGSSAEGLHLREYSFSDLHTSLKRAGFRKVLGFPLFPGFYPFFDKPSQWGSAKNRLCESLFCIWPLSALMRVDRRLSIRLVSVLFPCIAIGVK